MSIQPPVKIPNKLFFRIGEVSEITGVQPYTLRHWEMEFPTLSPKKNDAGQRLYRRADIEMVREIQRLLHHEGYTTAGAVRRLSTKKRTAGKRPSFPVPPPPASPPAPARVLAGVREALSIMESTDASLAALLEPPAAGEAAGTKSPAGAAATGKGRSKGNAPRK